MTEREAIVTRVAGDVALIEVTDAAACGSCAGKGGCGAVPAGRRRYAVRNGIGACLGDAVVISVPEGAVFKAAALSYLMPLLWVIAGAAAGTAWGGEGLPAVAGALFGLVLGLAALRFAVSREPLLRIRFKSRNTIDKDLRPCSEDSSFPSR